MTPVIIAVSTILILAAIFIEVKTNLKQNKDLEAIWHNLWETGLLMVCFFGIVWFCFWIVEGFLNYSNSSHILAIGITSVAWLSYNVKRFIRKETS